MATAPSDGTRAAASSMASGMPSRRRQIAAMAAAIERSGANPGSAACARVTNSLTASCRNTSSMSASSGGSARGGTR